MESAFNLCLLLLLAMVFGQFLLRYFYNYSLTEEAIRVRFIGVPIFSFPFSNIEDVKTISMKQFYKLNPFLSLRFGNRLWGRGAVLIIRRRAFFRFVAFTPSHSQETVDWVQKHINRRDTKESH
jgi:hypothetical protein